MLVRLVCVSRPPLVSARWWGVMWLVFLAMITAVYLMRVSREPPCWACLLACLTLLALQLRPLLQSQPQLRLGLQHLSQLQL